MIEYKINIIKLINRNYNLNFMVNDYESRFIGMYSVSLKGNVLLNKLMGNLLTIIYEICFIFLGLLLVFITCLNNAQRWAYGFVRYLDTPKKINTIKVRLEEKIGGMMNKAVTQRAKVFGLVKLGFLWHRCCIS